LWHTCFGPYGAGLSAGDGAIRDAQILIAVLIGSRNGERLRLVVGLLANALRRTVVHPGYLIRRQRGGATTR
jgi:hypothetical protein